MNEAAYDFAAIGNHEFDYGMERLFELKDLAKYTYLCCNLVDLRTGKLPFEPYRIIEAREKKIAFIGVTTPDSYSSSTPTYFQDEDGNRIVRNGDERRVGNIMVNGEPLDYERVYTVGGTAYILRNNGDGQTAFQSEVVDMPYIEDVQAAEQYLTEELGGEIPDTYAERYGAGRITIINAEAQTETDGAADAGADAEAQTEENAAA